MSGNYIPLYRKYRPQTLDTLVGQEHIKKTLTSAIELGKISHAYLFTGPRGTGKTSTARILAKSLNCKNGPTVHPCGECESCKDITNSIPIDVIEIDAASNRKVEDAQNLLEKIQYAPVNGKYKIYIIDEVHMLSTHAFNALLKTLEEPPENVIFILATTEVHKVLDTIKSRCQRFDFRRITTDDIVKHLRYISDKEKINITDNALFAIAKNSAGGMRDSISLLDQLSILGITKEITIDDVNSILGRISFDILNKLTEQLIISSPSTAIEMLNEIYNSGNEPLQILLNLNEYFKNILVTKTCTKQLLPELTGLNEVQIKDISAQAAKLETQQIIFLIERISYYIKEIKLASNQYLWLEVGIIDLANMTENTKLLDLQNRIRELENGNTTTNRQSAPVSNVLTITTPCPPQNIENHHADENAQTVTIKAATNDDETEFTPPPMAKKSDGKDLISMWELLLSNISSKPTQALLKQLATPVQISDNGVILTFKTDNWVTSMNEPAKKQMISEAVKAALGKDAPLTIKLAGESDNNSKQVEITVKDVPADKKKENINTTKKDKAPTTEDKTPEKVDEPSINISPSTQEGLSDRAETDQEKMILDLFDGKYVE